MTPRLSGHFSIDGFHSRGQHLCKFIGTKESFYIRKEFNSHRIFLVHQHGRRSIVLEDQDGGRDVTWSALYLVWFSLCSSLFWELRDKRVDLEKFTILALKPRSHVRILIHRTWASYCFMHQLACIEDTKHAGTKKVFELLNHKGIKRGKKCKLRSGIERLRTCLHEGGGPQVGEVTCGGLPHLTCKRDQVKWEIIWTGGLPLLNGLPRLPGVPHLHVNRP